MQYLRTTLIGACIWSASIAGPAFADGVIRDSVGATSSGRGGTNIAHADNGAILLSNPAGMVNIDANGLFEIGIDTLVTDLHYTDPENSRDASVLPYELPELAYIRRSDDGIWAAGVGVFVPAGFGGEWNLASPILGRNGYSSFGAVGKIIPGLAVRVTDRLSVGATLGMAISHVELESPLFLQTGALAGVPTVSDLQASGVAVTWSAGLQYQLTDQTRLGFVYSSQQKFELDGHFSTSAYGLGPDPIQSRFDAAVNMTWPSTIGAGLTHQLSARQRVSMEVLWYGWSNAFDSLDIKLTDSSNPIFPFLLGPEINDSIPLKWMDSISPRFGYEFQATPCDVFRVGYIYTAPTIPSSTLTPWIPATLEHTFSVGYGRTRGNRHIDFAYQYAFGEDEVGVSDLVGGDFNSSKIEAQAHWFFLSFTQKF